MASTVVLGGPHQVLLTSSYKVPLKKSYKEIAAAKQAETFSKIPSEWLLNNTIPRISLLSAESVLDIPRTCGILSPAEVEITENYTAVVLTQEMAAGRLSAVQVTEAFCKRAAIAQQLVRCGVLFE
jgi:amidase